MFCKHKYKVISEKEIQRWSDSPNEWHSLISCKNCGKTKYIHNTFQWDKFWGIFIGGSCLGIFILALVAKWT